MTRLPHESEGMLSTCFATAILKFWKVYLWRPTLVTQEQNQAFVNSLMLVGVGTATVLARAFGCTLPSQKEVEEAIESDLAASPPASKEALDLIRAMFSGGKN